MKEWTDEECFSPIAHQLPTPNPVQQHLNPPLSTVTAPPVNNNCVACNHKHREGECRCGCKEFIG